MENIFLGMLILFGFLLIIALVALGKLRVELYFLSFNFEKHPKILKFMDDKLSEICKKEGISVFNKDYEDVNKDSEEDDYVVGKIIYTLDQEHQERCNKNLQDIINMESESRQSLDEIYKSVGRFHNRVTKEDFTLPRIILCENYLKKTGVMSYYFTFLHELGHHYAVKEIGKHNERDADEYAYEIVKKEFPLFFRLFFGEWFSYRNETIKLREIEKIVYYFNYLKFLIQYGRN